MFALIRWLFSLVLLCVVLWFAVTVPLGKRTLWGHLHAIFATQEAKDLAHGAEEEAKKVADRVREELHRDAGQPLDPLDEHDRKGLDKLVHDKTKKAK
jgi:hypothetical protein